MLMLSIMLMVLIAALVGARYYTWAYLTARKWSTAALVTLVIEAVAIGMIAGFAGANLEYFNTWFVMGSAFFGISAASIARALVFDVKVWRLTRRIKELHRQRDALIAAEDARKQAIHDKWMAKIRAYSARNQPNDGTPNQGDLR